MLRVCSNSLDGSTVAVTGYMQRDTMRPNLHNAVVP